MMAETIKLKVEIDDNESVKTLNSLEEELQQLKDQIKGVEVGSKEFKKLSEQIRSTESEVKNLNKSFEGLDIDQVTGEFGRLTGGIAAAATGIAVLGDGANESMEAMLKTVAKGMAIAQGFRGAAEAASAATRVWNTVQKYLNKTMLSNPVVLITTAVIALGIAIYELTQRYNSNTKSIRGNTEAYKEYLKVIQEVNDENLSISDQINLMMAKRKLENGEINEYTYERIRLAQQEKSALEKINDEKIKSLQEYQKKVREGAFTSEEVASGKKRMEILNQFETKKYLTIELYKQKRINLDQKESNEKLNEQKKYQIESLKSYQEYIKKIVDTKTKQLDELSKEITDDTELYLNETDEEIQANEKWEKSEQRKIDLIKKVKTWNAETYKERKKQLNQELEDIEKLYKHGRISADEYNAALKRIKKSMDELDKTTDDSFFNMITKGLDGMTAATVDGFNAIQTVIQADLSTYDAYIKRHKDGSLELMKANRIYEEDELEQINKLFVKYKEAEEGKTDIKNKEAKTQMAIAGTLLQLTNQLIDASVDKEKLSANEKKKLAETKAVINIASGVLMALGSAEPPYSYIMAAMTAALGAVQLIKIQNAKYAQGGLISGPSHAQGGITTPYGELEGGEAIINKSSMSNPSLRNIASAVNVAGGGKSFGSGDGSIQLSNTTIDLIVNGINNKKVYVTEGDITSTQNKVKILDESSVL